MSAGSAVERRGAGCCRARGRLFVSQCSAGGSPPVGRAPAAANNITPLCAWKHRPGRRAAPGGVFPHRGGQRRMGRQRRIGEGALGQETGRSDRQRRIGAGNGALGQVINLPQCGLTCPSRRVPTPMRLVGKRRRRGARSHGYTVSSERSGPGAMGCSHSDTGTTGRPSTAIPARRIPLSRR